MFFNNKEQLNRFINNETKKETKKEQVRFEAGKTYTCNDIDYLCVSVTDEEVTFARFRRRNKKTGEKVYRTAETYKILGIREPQQKAAIHTWYVDRQKYSDFIFAA